MKVLTADKVKKLPIGTYVYLVRDADGQRGKLWVAKTRNRKWLKGVYGEYEIKDRAGWHYEVDDGTDERPN